MLRSLIQVACKLNLVRTGRFIALAAYGDCVPGDIGTEAAYPQGGYETNPSSSLVAPSVE